MIPAGFAGIFAILAPRSARSVAKVAESVDALALGASGATRESSNLSFRTSFPRDVRAKARSADLAGGGDARTPDGDHVPRRSEAKPRQVLR